MAQRSIREYHAKRLLAQVIAGNHDTTKGVLVDENTNWKKLPTDHSWLSSTPLVVKPDQLIGKRGKHNLLLLNASLNDAEAFVQKHLGQTITVGSTTGALTHFLIEPFVPHEQGDEYYLSFRAEREHDVIAFSQEGGIEIEENWEKVQTYRVSLGSTPTATELEQHLLADAPAPVRTALAQGITAYYDAFVTLGCTFLEVNPLVVKDGELIPLDLKVRLDDTAAFEKTDIWGDLPFPAPFGQHLSPEEEYIKQLDGKSGSSLKLTVLNPAGRIWSLVAGGGASVVYADTIADLGAATDLANYGEYSGNPTTDETYAYTTTVLDLMTRKPDDQGRGKVLLIGGGIANFTDVAKTFTGIIKAIRDYQQKLHDCNVTIYVRRGGPNYREGLDKMRRLGEELSLPISVYGPETHMTKIVSMALE